MAALGSPRQTLRAVLPARARHLSTLRLSLGDAARTTLYVASYDAADFEVEVALLPRPAPLARWCRANGVQEAVVGGFYVRPSGVPLGELRTRGILRPSAPFDAPWDGLRACVHVAGGKVALARRDRLPAEPAGDLLQAGPLLLSAGRPVLDGDPEGFSAGAAQFDSDITSGRYPRAALALCGERILAVACDGRAESEAGLTLVELAGALADLGASEAINLDGGGSTSLVCGGRLRNQPREEHGIVIAGGRAVSTALVFRRRR